MVSTRSLCLLAIAGSAWLHALPAAAEEEEGKHPEYQRHRSGAPTSPRAPENHVTSGSGRPSNGESLYANPAQDTNYAASTHSSTFTELSNELDVNGYTTYTGLGAGKGAAHFPSSSYSKFAWQFFLGARLKYVGAEFGYTHLSTIPATINSQPVDLITDSFSLSLLGYLPLTGNTDLFLRYGGVRWTVNANGNTTGYVPVTNGFDRVWGGGLEFRRGSFLLGIEKDIFRHVYQSNFYSFVGVRVGMYFN